MTDPLNTPHIKPPRVSTRDLTAGITNAVTNIPDAMANAVLAGLNPIQGLYAIMIGTPAAALTTGSQLMTVAVTGAMALIVGDSLAGIPADQKLNVLIALTVLVGIVQVVLGLARAGTLVRFVSNAVLRGFLTGVAVNIVLSQLSEFTGYASSASGKVMRMVDTVLHASRIDPKTLAIGVLTIVVVLLWERTPARDFAFLVGLVVSTLAATLLNWDVRTVRTLAEIPTLLPRPALPSLTQVYQIGVPAISIALVGLIQGAGVSKTVPNRDGTYPDMNRDFIGQGVGNAAAGFFGGMPIGGSVSSTALVVQLGARSRLANFLVGPIIALVVLLLANQVEMIPLATLAALLIIVGIRAVNVGEIQTVWQTAIGPRAIMVATFAATLVIPVQYAVILGVALSVVQHVYSASLDIRVVALVPAGSGRFAEEPAPVTLPNHSVTALDIYGSVFYAGADVVGKLLPDALGSKHPAVIIRLRGRTDVGSTFLGVLKRYHDTIVAADGRLMLAGVGPELRDQLDRTGMTMLLGEENLFAAQPVLSASMEEALAAARTWLAR